jgi:hypothetical protein
MITKLKTHALAHPLLTLCLLITSALLVAFSLAKVIEHRSEVRLHQLERGLSASTENQSFISPWGTPVEQIGNVAHVSGVDKFSCERADIIAAECEGGVLKKVF